MENKSVLFIKSKKKENCSVFKQYTLLTQSIWSIFYKNYLLVNDNSPEFSEISTASKQVIIFGYKDIDYPLLETENNNISHKWFKEKIPIGIFFMPKGMELFEYSGWQEKFENIVTFKNKYEFLIDDLPVIKRTSPKIYRKILKAISFKMKPEEIITKIKGIYESSVVELMRLAEKNPDNGDDIIMMIHKIRFNIYNLI